MSEFKLNAKTYTESQLQAVRKMRAGIEMVMVIEFVAETENGEDNRMLRFTNLDTAYRMREFFKFDQGYVVSELVPMLVEKSSLTQIEGTEDFEQIIQLSW